MWWLVCFCAHDGFSTWLMFARGMLAERCATTDHRQLIMSPFNVIIRVTLDEMTSTTLRFAYFNPSARYKKPE